MPKRRYKSKKKNRNMFYAIGGIALVAIVGIGLLFAISPLSPFAPTTTTPTTDTSSFSFLSYPDGEDVSNFIEIDVWVPKSSAEFEDIEDIYTLSNFEVLGATKEAEDVAIDMTDYLWVWIEVDPDATSVFENTFILINGGRNADYTMYAYHLASDVNFNMVDSTTMNEITVADYQTDGNYTILFDVPHHTTTNIHANTADWAVDDDDWDDMTTTEKEFYYDEANFRSEAPLYDPSVATTDSKQNLDLALADITSTFAFKITCNGTVGSDDSVTGINMTIDDDNVNGNVYRLNDGTVIYLVFESAIPFTSGIQQIGLELQFGADITLSDIDSGRLAITGHIYSTGTLTFTKLSDIGA